MKSFGSPSGVAWDRSWLKPQPPRPRTTAFHVTPEMRAARRALIIRQFSTPSSSAPELRQPISRAYQSSHSERDRRADKRDSGAKTDARPLNQGGNHQDTPVKTLHRSPSPADSRPAAQPPLDAEQRPYEGIGNRQSESQIQHPTTKPRPLTPSGSRSGMDAAKLAPTFGQDD